ncbi:MAG: hypothetical protein HZB62_03315 [Nitrospirae bacterium]|nr:hypothetical protein [Nitrospirota bacterium]
MVDLNLDRQAADNGDMQGKCEKKKCKNTQALLSAVKADASLDETEERYCLTGFNCQKWAKNKLGGYCE